MSVNIRFVATLVSVSILSVATVLGATLLSIGVVVGIKTTFGFLLRLVAALTEIVVALVAAVTSGGTVTLSVLVAAGSAGMAIPASLLELRVAMSAAISMAAIVVASCAVFYLTCPTVDMEIAVAVTSAAGLAVACASAWAVGVMSLIEKETQQVGLKMTSILDAVRNNKHFMLRLLVKLHAGFKSRDRELDLALLHAVKAGFVECTEILVSAGANPNVTDAHGNTPLIHACETGNTEVVRLLTNIGCDVNKSSNLRCTALHHAAKWGFVECVQVLLDHGARVDVQDVHWRTPIILTAGHAQEANKVMRMLVEAGCDVNIICAEGRRVLHYAAARGLDVTDLVKAGSDVPAHDDEGNQALHYAAYEGSAIAVSTLMEAGADPNSPNFSGRSALHCAATRGRIDCMDTLVKAKGDPTRIDQNGKSALCYAVENDNLPVVIYLVQYNCPIGPSNDVFRDHSIQIVDPVSLAMDKRHVHIVRALVIGGFPCKALFDWLNHTPEELWVEGKIEHVSWLRDFLSNPSLLSHLSRLVIRQRMGRDVPKKLHCLPLPTKLKQYIQFIDLSETSITGQIRNNSLEVQQVDRSFSK